MIKFLAYLELTNLIPTVLPFPFKQASLCLLDIEKRKLSVPDELPGLPHAEELEQELSDLVNKFRKKNESSPSNLGKTTTSEIPRKSVTKSDARLTARKPVKKIDALKAGLTNLKLSKSSSQLTASDGRNPRLASLEKIAQKTGIQTNLSADKDKTRKHSLDEELHSSYVIRDEHVKELYRKEREQCEFNFEIREILVNWFTQVFLDYDTFVIQPRDSQDMDQWLQNREQMENFDKAAFLSDQPAQFLPFLAPFIESQMFATFIDTKLIGCWSDPDPRLAIFDQRINQMKDKSGIVRSYSYQRCQSVKKARKLNNWCCIVVVAVAVNLLLLLLLLLL